MHLCRVYRQFILPSRYFHSSASVKALSALAQPIAERISANWKGTSATGSSTKNFVGGEFIESKATEWIDVHDPVSHISELLRLPIFNAFSSSQPRQSLHEFLKRLTQNSKMLSMPLPRLLKHGVELVSSAVRDLSSSTFVPIRQSHYLIMYQVATSAARECRRYCPQHCTRTR